MSGLLQQSLNPHHDNVRLASTITQSSPWQCWGFVDNHSILTLTMSGSRRQISFCFPETRLALLQTWSGSSLRGDPTALRGWQKLQGTCDCHCHSYGHFQFVMVILIVMWRWKVVFQGSLESLSPHMGLKWGYWIFQGRFGDTENFKLARMAGR